MAFLINNGSVNLATANTSWRGFDSGGAVTTTGTNISLTTSNVTTSNFTITNGKTTDGVLLSAYYVSGGTGTITVELFDGTSVVATVTVNANTLPGVSSSQNALIFFKWDATYTSTGLTTMALRVRVSSNGSCGLKGSGATAPYKRIRITDNATLSAADTPNIVDELNSSSGRVHRTVTMDNTASTVFGATDIWDGATLAYGNSASTSYLYKTNGNLTVNRNATFTMGTSGASIPSTSTAELFFNNAVNVDCGLLINDGATFTTHGASKTKYQLLAADYSSGTSITLDGTPTNWKNGDTLAFASTTRTSTQAETKTLGADVTTTTGTLSSGLSNAHGGSSPIQAEVINLNRHVRIHGASSSLQAYTVFNNTATVSCTNTEFYFMGSNAATQRGIDVLTTTGSCTFSGCAMHDFVAANSSSFFIAGTSTNNISITDCVMYNTDRGGIEIAAASSGNNVTIADCVLIKCSTSLGSILLADVGFTGGLSGMRISSGGGYGIELNENNASGTALVINNCVIHSTGADGIKADQQTTAPVTVSNCSIWRATGSGISISGVHADSWIIDTCTFFGNSTAGITVSGSGSIRNWVLKSCTFNAGTTLTQPIGWNVSAGCAIDCRFDSCSFGATTTHATGDFSVGVPGFFTASLRNCTLGSTTEVSGQATMARGCRIGSSKHDATTATHKTFLRQGTLQYDTTRYGTASPSAKITPNNASEEFVWPIPMICCVDNGDTVTINVKVRKSNVTSADGFANDAATYNGNQPKLYVRANPAVGIAADTLIDTCTSAADGAFETLTGTTAAVTDDGALEFYITCDGTAGTIWVDDWSAT